MMQRCWQSFLPLAGRGWLSSVAVAQRDSILDTLPHRASILNLLNKRTVATDAAPVEELDAFEREYVLKHRIQITPFQKLLLGAGSSIAALLDPRRHEMIATLGETTGENALWNILDTMQASDEGRRILAEKPRINTQTIDFRRLEALPPDTFGATYAKFLKDNNVTPDSRMVVQFLDDPKLAYLMTRYRECHDLIHTVLNMPTNMLGEVTVKWVEALNTGLPMCYGGAVFGAVRLRPVQRREYLKRYLPWAIENGKQMKPLMPVYWEQRWEQNVNDLRAELGVKLLQ